MNEYEELRLARIRANQRRMQELQLPALAASLSPADADADAATATKRKPPPPRGLGASKRKQSSTSPDEPRRYSRRVKGEHAEDIQIEDEVRGAVTVGSFYNGSGGINPSTPFPSTSAEQEKPRDRYPQEQTIPFRSVNCSLKSDQQFLSDLVATSSSSEHADEVLRSTTTKTRRSNNSSSSKTSSSSASTATKTATAAAASMSDLLRMKLNQNDVAKVTKEAITHLAFLPRSDGPIVLAAGDKRGNIGLWNVSHTPTDGTSTEEEEEEYEAYDGVLSFKGIHYEYISGLRWHGTTLFTCSYDGSLRRLDLDHLLPFASSHSHSKEKEKERETNAGFTLAWGDEDKEYSCFDVNSTATTAYIGDKDGELDVVDLRSRQRTASLRLHRKKINTVHVDPGSGSYLMVSASTDQSVALWDVRKLEKGKSGKSHQGTATPIAQAHHDLTCQSAFLCPDGSQRVVSTSFDRTIRVWDGKKDLAPIVKIKHDTNTGRWILPFRGVWGGRGDAVEIGRASCRERV